MRMGSGLVGSSWSCAALLALAAGCGGSESPASAFQGVLDDHWDSALAEQVFFRSDPDAWRMNGKLAAFTFEARARRKAFNEEILTRLQEIDIDDLDAMDQVSYRVFHYERLTERDSYFQKDHLFPFTSMFGYHTYFAEAPAAMSFLTAADYKKYLVSLDDFPRYNNEHIELLKEAVTLGYTHYCGSMGGYEKTISNHIVDDVKKSGLYVPFLDFPDTIDDERRAEFTASGVALIESKVIPGTGDLFGSRNRVPSGLISGVSL